MHMNANRIMCSVNAKGRLASLILPGIRKDENFVNRELYNVETTHTTPQLQIKAEPSLDADRHTANRTKVEIYFCTVFFVEEWRVFLFEQMDFEGFVAKTHSKSTQAQATCFISR